MAIKDSVYVNVVTKTDKAGKNMLKFAGTVTAAAAAIAGMYKIGKALIDAYKIQEQAEAKLAAVIKSTGGAAGLTKREMLEMASALQAVTTYGDEAIIGAQGILTTFTKIGKETFPEALEAALNMSTMFGQDLKMSSIMLGKALQDPVTGIGALKRVGVVLTKTQEESIRTFAEQNDIASAQAIILNELKTEVGGVARAMADTATGAMTQLKNAFGDLKEEQGEALARGLAPYVRSLTGLIQKLGEARKLINEDAAYMEKLGKEQVSAADSLKYWQNQLELSESKNWLGKIWMRARYAKQIQSKELIEARIKEYELQAKIEADSAKYDAKQKARAQEELEALKAKADMLEIIGDVQTGILTRMEEKRFAALTPLEQELYLMEQEVESLAEVRSEAEKAGLAKKDYMVVQERINKLILDLIPALKKEMELTTELVKESELVQDSTEQRIEIERKYQIAVMGEKEAALARLEDYYAKELRLAVDLGASTLNLMESYSQERTAVLEEYAKKEVEINKDKLGSMKEDVEKWLETTVESYGMAFGAMLIGAEGSAEGMKDAMKGAVVSILKMLGAWAFAEAMIKVTNPFTIPQGVALFAASVGAYTAAGAVNAMAEGGVINEPVYGVGQSGQRYLFGEAGPERVIPLSAPTSRVTFNIHGNTFAGAGGVREFVIEIRKEFNSLDTLGL